MLLMKLSLWIGMALIQLHGYKACVETKRIALLEIKSFFISASDVGFDDEILSSWFDDDGMSSDSYDSFGSLKQLKILNLGGNFFNDNILPYLNTLTSLTTLNLRSNNIEGSRIKHGLADLRNLQVLDLTWNLNLTSGSLRSLGLAYLQYLKAIGLRGCGITTSGKMDDGLRSSTSLEGLDISGNIPNWIGNISTLRVLLMSKNYLEANIPVQLNHLKSLELIDIFENSLSGTMVSSFNLSSVKHLYLQKNAITGIPYQINELSNLHVLLLRGNSLQGHIPNELCQLAKLPYQGFYIDSIATTFYNSTLNLQPPTEPHASINQTVEAELCGSLIRKKCSSALKPPATPTEGAEEEEDDSMIDMVALKWSFGASFVTVILGLFAVLWINSYWRRRWFYFIDECIDTCYYWLFKYAFYR
ncbi:Receptor-like protein 56 [Citrus sinensis]|nr:Receptor-like protein 56 [Citrus sinensis]